MKPNLSKLFTVTALWVFAASSLPTSAAEDRPNVLLIAIDDMNDWAGCLGGHPLAKTPNIDKLAARGTLFTNAHCQSPLCNPSRTSFLMSLRPSTTGIYGLSPSIRSLPEWSGRASVAQHFQKNGYRTLSTGKIWHGNPRGPEKEFDVKGNKGGVGVKPDKKLIGPTPGGDHPLMDWGVFPHKDEDKGDHQVASWGVDQLQAYEGDQPFFMALGFFLPHVPCYITQPWMDLYPDDDTVLPPMIENDREDTPRFSWYLHWELPEPRLVWLKKSGQLRNLARSYLASISFVDAQVGRLMDALEKEGYADNTIVVLLSDHGYHLGEKEISGKNTLWDRSTRVPLVFAGPGVTVGGRCGRPAELLDIYPTLCELAKLPVPEGLDGISLVPQVKNDEAPRERPAITTHGQGNHGIRSEKWRYIRYADGSEELYDMVNDSNEWTNLAGKSEHQEVMIEHRRWLPTPDVPAAPNSASRVLIHDPATGKTTWEGKPILPDSPIPMLE